jgi:VWFA-related protein
VGFRWLSAAAAFVGIAILTLSPLTVIALQTPARLEISVVQVPLIVTVTDNKGQLIADLRRDHFRVFEDSRLQKIDSFARVADVPLSVALLVDTSNSAASQLSFERKAAAGFFSSAIKKGKDRATIVSYDSEPRLLADFTDNVEALDKGLAKMIAGGSTALYDAVYLASQKKLAQEQGERRRLIVLLGDGYDTASDYSLDEALEMAQKADVVIYAISTNKLPDTGNTSGSEKAAGDKALTRMAAETGGRVFFPRRLEEMGAEFEKIEAEVRSQYLVSFTPAGPLNGAYRKLRIELTDRKYTARTRSGYFASK